MNKVLIVSTKENGRNLFKIPQVTFCNNYKSILGFLKMRVSIGKIIYTISTLSNAHSLHHFTVPFIKQFIATNILTSHRYF